MESKTRIICDSCGWSWKKSEGGDDLYVCHKCYHNNEPLKHNNLRHMQTFEQFVNENLKIEYNLVKDFPPKGCCECADVEEADVLCEMLEKAKYVNSNQGSFHELQDVKWKAEHLTIVWRDQKYWRMSQPASEFMDEISSNQIDFDEYFEVEDRYRGRQIGKRYGI